MKTWRRIHKAAVAVGMIYGMWLGCNVEATSKDTTSGFIMVTMALVVALSMLIPEKEQEKNL